MRLEKREASKFRNLFSFGKIDISFRKKLEISQKQQMWQKYSRMRLKW